VIQRLEAADSGSSTVLFCTHIDQVHRLIVQQDLLAKELRLKHLKFANDYTDTFVTQQHKGLADHPQYHHIPYVCLTF
jgi:hypothetical protein